MRKLALLLSCGAAIFAAGGCKTPGGSAPGVQIPVPLLGGDGWESPELLKLGGEALNGSYYSNHYYAEDPDPGIQEFVAKYKTRYGREPDSIAALAYDATMVLKVAMERAPNLDGRTLRDTLAGIRGYKAVTGEISFDEQRNPGTKAILMLGIQGGKLKVVDRVAPPSMAPASQPSASASAAPASSDGFKTIPGGANAVHNDTGKGDIVLGFYGSLTGEQATFGQSSREGTELAVEEINSAGGIKVGGQGAARKIHLVSEDDGGKQEQATNVVSKLINSDKAVAIVGEVASSMSLAGGTVANDAGIPMVSGSSTNPTVTRKEFVFRVCFTDDYQGRMLARFAYEKLGLKTAALLVDVKQAYAVGLAKVFREEYLALGGKIVTEQKYQNGDVDLKAQLTAIKSTAPQVIFMPGYYNDAGTAARQARELGIMTFVPVTSAPAKKS